MANSRSQKKRIARSAREHDENLYYKSAIKTYFKKLEEKVSAGDGDAVKATHKQLVSRIDKAAKTGALHKNSAARKKSQAAKLVSTKS